MPRKDSDLDDFNLPNKRHRTQRSPKKTFDSIDTGNSFSPLDAGESDLISGSCPPSDKNPKSLADNSRKQNSHSSKMNTSLQKQDQNGAKVKLQKNFTAPIKSSSKKREQSNNLPR